jgi:hypothetical protein
VHISQHRRLIIYITRLFGHVVYDYSYLICEYFLKYHIYIKLYFYVPRHMVPAHNWSYHEICHIQMKQGDLFNIRNDSYICFLPFHGLVYENLIFTRAGRKQRVWRWKIRLPKMVLKLVIWINGSQNIGRWRKWPPTNGDVKWRRPLPFLRVFLHCDHLSHFLIFCPLFFPWWDKI